MGLLQKLKAALGLDGAGASEGRGGGGVTVEHEPSTENEDAVKGTDGPRAPQSASAAGSDAEPVAETSTVEETPDEAAETGDASVEAGEDDDAATAEASEDEGEESEAAADEESDPVDTINGIGPTYAERLADAGIDTVADLAAADAATVADASQASESRAADWIEQASER